MGTRRLAALVLAAALAQPALSQVYPYFGPANGILKGTTSSGVTTSATASDLATLATCSSRQIVFTNSTPAFACSVNLTWADSTGTLTVANGGVVIFNNPANATNQKNTAFSANVDGLGNFGFATQSDLGVTGDTVAFTRNGNTLTGFTMNFSGAIGGLMQLVLSNSTDLKLIGLNQPHYQVIDTNTAHNVGIDLENAAATATASFVCFGSTFAGASPFAGGPSGPSCLLGNLIAGITQPDSFGSLRNEMIRLDGQNGTLLLKVSPSGSSHTAGNIAFQAVNTAGVVVSTYGDTTNSASQAKMQSGSASANTFIGHNAYTGTAPTVSACGTSPSIDAHATDTSGTVTVGTVSATSCTVTFAIAYGTWNHCRVTSQGVITSFAYSYSLSAITVTGASLVGDLFDYQCDGT